MRSTPSQFTRIARCSSALPMRIVPPVMGISMVSAVSVGSRSSRLASRRICAEIAEKLVPEIVPVIVLGEGE